MKDGTSEIKHNDVKGIKAYFFPFFIHAELCPESGIETRDNKPTGAQDPQPHE